jgi:replicative DNA helicase
VTDLPERAVLGAVLLDPACLSRVRPILSRPESFRDGVLRAVYAGMLRLADRGSPIDHVTLSAELASQRLPDLDLTLAELIDEGSVAANAPAHALLVLDGYRRREAAAVGQSLTTLANDPETAIRDTLAALSARLVPLAAPDPLGDRKPLVRVFSEALSRLEQRVKQHGQLLGPSTGFEGLDSLTDGLTDGELWILAARPSQGKTALALHFMRTVSAEGPVMLFSLEMDEDALVERLLSAEAGCSLRYARRSPDYFDRHAGGIAQAAGRLSSLPLVIDTTSRSPAMIRLAVQGEILQGRRPVLVVVDYLGLLQPDVAAENRNHELGRMTADLKRMAQDFKVPVVALAQLNRASAREDRAPELFDLRDSGEIEQHADVVPMLHWPTGKAERGPTAVDLYVRKERNGETGKVPVLFETWTQRFLDASEAQEAVA